MSVLLCYGHSLFLSIQPDPEASLSLLVGFKPKGIVPKSREETAQGKMYLPDTF